MTARLFLGVDGGGTKTRFALLDADRNLVAEHRLGDEVAVGVQQGEAGLRAAAVDAEKETCRHFTSG